MKTVSERVESTIAYMESPRGIANWVRNRDEFHMPHSANVFAAIQTATRLRKYRS